MENLSKNSHYVSLLEKLQIRFTALPLAFTLIGVNTLIHQPISKRETGKSNFIASVNQTLFAGQVKAKGGFFNFSF